MNCFYHPDRPAVSTCSDCGKGLCRQCASKWDPILCDSCAGNQLSTHESKLKKAIISGAVLFVIGFVFILITEKNILTALLGGYVLAGIVSGWIRLNKIQPAMFLFLPVIGWAIYFSIKVMLSCFVGLVAFPVNIINCISELKENKRMQETIK